MQYILINHQCFEKIKQFEVKVPKRWVVKQFLPCCDTIFSQFARTWILNCFEQFDQEYWRYECQNKNLLVCQMILICVKNAYYNIRLIRIPESFWSRATIPSSTKMTVFPSPSFLPTRAWPPGTTTERTTTERAREAPTPNGGTSCQGTKSKSNESTSWWWRRPTSGSGRTYGTASL